LREGQALGDEGVTPAEARKSLADDRDLVGRQRLPGVCCDEAADEILDARFFRDHYDGKVCDLGSFRAREFGGLEAVVAGVNVDFRPGFFANDEAPERFVAVKPGGLNRIGNPSNVCLERGVPHSCVEAGHDVDLVERNIPQVRRGSACVLHGGLHGAFNEVLVERCVDRLKQ